jgi:hypothetical protein
MQLTFQLLNNNFPLVKIKDLLILTLDSHKQITLLLLDLLLQDDHLALESVIVLKIINFLVSTFSSKSIFNRQ